MPPPTHILGISAFYHDAAAAILRDGAIVAAAQEERFTRKKGDPSFPEHAIAYCLEAAGLEIAEVDHVVYYEKPLLHFERLLETYMSTAPRGLTSFLRAMPIWLKDKLFLRKQLKRLLHWEGTLLFTEHHESHMGAAFYPSPFEEAAILTVDGVGEWATTTWGIGRGAELKLGEEIHFPHSLGLLYSAFTYYLGFKINFGEYKVMGLAPYGEPTYVDAILEHVVDLRQDGSFRFDLRYFNFLTGLTMTSPRFHALFGGPPRDPEGPLEQRHMDLARSVQVVVEEIMLRMARYVYEKTGMKRLCLGGGVALNCVANGRILREGPFEELWIQPAAGDAGSALGAAFVAWHRYLERPRHEAAARGGEQDAQQGTYLGPRFSTEEIKACLSRFNAPFEELDPSEVPARVAQMVADQKVVGLFQGRMEFGPRALGNRTILGDPRSPEMQRTVNLKIKYRESFRPFAPAVLRERVAEYFEHQGGSPYMLIVAPVAEARRRALSPEEEQLQGLAKLQAPRSDVPAITHVDGSARIQTVHVDTNPGFHAILQAFEAQTGCATMINTSFNVRGEPIVCTPEDAYRCFMRTEMDVLVLENLVLTKAQQPELLEEADWRDRIALD